MTAAETKIELKIDKLQNTITDLCSQVAILKEQINSIYELVQKHEAILNGNGGVGIRTAFAQLETAVNQSRMLSAKKCIFWGAAAIGCAGAVIAAVIKVL